MFAAASALGQQKPPEPQEPPEEEESSKVKEYSFNPLQASKELKVGEYYFKKGKYAAAAHRFEEAGKWDPTSAEAFLRLGNAREKLKDQPGAKEAYQKYLELAPDAKNASAIRKKIGQK
jgi:tetratricopeptide (TPR) repeat protein